MAEASEQQRPRFPSVQNKIWREAVESGLRGKKIEEKLATRTSDGLEIQPLYSDALESPEEVPLRRARTWTRREPLTAFDLNRALARMENATAHGIHGFQVAAPSLAEESELLSQAQRLGTTLHFSVPVDGPRALARLRANLSGTQTLNAGGLDSRIVEAWRKACSTSTLHSAASSIEQSRGAGSALQIALCLSRGATWLREAEQAGLSITEAVQAMEFHLGLGTDLFLEVAKIRALRLAWAKLLTSIDPKLSSTSTPIHVESSERSWTRRDPWINGLRGTTIAFAAAIAGADSILVQPFDALLGHSDADSLRLAANTHAILEEESHLATVQDPTAGSGYVETLTVDLARSAWLLFQELERLGDQSLDYIEEEIRGTAEEEERAIATRRRGLIGISEFPNLAEELPQREAHAPTKEFTTLAAPYEALRQASDEFTARTGAFPEVFLLNFGSQIDYRARSGFAANLLAAGGLKVIDGQGYNDVENALTAFEASASRVAVIASTDELYIQHVPELAAALRANGARVLVAGKPGDQEPEWANAGVQHYMHLGCDALALLRELHEYLEINA